MGGPPEAGRRARVTKTRVWGKLIKWKGKFGWIKPLESIDHPAASLRGGMVYVGQEDVEGELQLQGQVSFFVYADDTGLGAARCRPVAGPSGPVRRPPAEAPPWLKNGSAGKGRDGTYGTRFGAIGAPRGSVHSFLPKGVVRGSIAKGGNPKGVAGKGSAGKSQISHAGDYNGRVLRTIVKRPPQKASYTSRRIEEDGEEASADGARKQKGGAPEPDKDAREVVLATAVTGKLIRWRGNAGWVRPHEPIDHPEAEKHGGRIYLHEVDVEPGQTMRQGAQVCFTVYADPDGLGAENCRLTEEQPSSPERKPGKGVPKIGGKGMRGTLLQASNTSKGAVLTKGKAKGKGNIKGKGALGEKFAQAQKQRLKGVERRPRQPGGPDLPRERVTTVAVSGEVVEWKRKFGWLKPTEPLDHELAESHGGRIYIHQRDVLSGEPLEPGQSVEFHVYADSSGLGAEECVNV